MQSRYTSTRVHTHHPHSVVRKGWRVALRVGLDKGCIFLLVFFFFSFSSQAWPWPLPQSQWHRQDFSVSSINSSPLLRHSASSRWRCFPRGPGPPAFAPRKPKRCREVGKWVLAQVELPPWQTQMMTHRLDEGLCQKPWGSGVSAQRKTKGFCQS